MGNKVIAVSGKGGTGKTTVAALAMHSLIKMNRRPVLGVDADPNSNLGETLGLDIDMTIGDMLEDFLRDPTVVPGSMTKDVYLQMRMNQVLVERKGFDLLVMGRPEGPGCYCMVNNILRQFLEELHDNYKVAVIDNEAGMEHFSRNTNAHIDSLWLVTDHALRGLRAVKRIKQMIDGMRLDVDEMGIVVNRAPEQLSPAFLAEQESIGLPIWGTIPSDPLMQTFDLEQKSMMELPDDSPAGLAVEALLKKTLGE